MSILLRILSVFLLTATLLTAIAQPVKAAKGEFIHCNYVEADPLAQDEERTVYYSAVFLADYSDARRFKSDFAKYLRNEYSAKRGDAYCFFQREEPAAKRDQERRMDDDKRVDLYDHFEQTGWRPSGADNSPISDFHISVCNPSDTVEICVNDHACEDGDEIRVSFNGGVIFSGELFNQWDCDDVSVSAGNSYSLDLLALNETGGKGGCPNQVNTGAMRVTGANTQTQEWRHRGQTGSTAQLIVTLDDSCAPAAAPQATPGQTSGANSGQNTPAQTQTQVAPAPIPAPPKPAQNPNLCEFANDGECDEPHFCEVGTDGNDCN